MIVTFLVLRHKERNGNLPFMKAKHDLESDNAVDREITDVESDITPSQEKDINTKNTESNIAEIHSTSS